MLQTELLELSKAKSAKLGVCSHGKLQDTVLAELQYTASY